MVEQDLSQASESFEAASESVSMQELDEATHDPGTRLENLGSAEQSEAIEASVTKLVENTITVASESSQKLEDSGTAKMTPQRMDKELDEARTQGKQMTEKDLEGEMDPTKGIEDFQDPFGVDKSLDGGPLASPHGPGGQGAGAAVPGSDLGGLAPSGSPNDLLKGFDQEMPKDTPGGPGDDYGGR